ncbi:unnamed protein product, partial [Brachionus calyciflorus]
MKVEILKNLDKLEIYGDYDIKWITIIKEIGGSRFSNFPKRWIVSTSQHDNLVTKLEENDIDVEFIKEKIFPEKSIIAVRFEEDNFKIKLPVPK